VWTSSYRAWSPGLGVPVGITVGLPKWFPEPLVEWRTVAPFGLLGAGLEPAEYRRRYRHRLHRLTPRIVRELAELREAYGPADLILCCYEPAGAWCHRVLLAEFLAEHGVPVEEVVPPTP
jgi:hypothetical protein